MANGYDPGAFDIIREEYEDRRPEPERPERDRRMPERVREDDRDRDEARLADDLQKELNKLDEVQAEMAYNDLSDMAEEMQDQRLENALAKIGRRRPMQFNQGRQTIRRSRQFSRANILPRIRAPAKKKRKVSKYQKEFGKQLKKLVKKHPRTKVTKLMKRAHTATRKAMK